MRVGVTLPQFRTDAELAIDAAQRAEAAGLDGVFVFDHLWPMDDRQRPILAATALLGALAAETKRVTLGPLVARVSVLPNPVLVHTLVTLHRMLGDRFVASLGTGDSGNRDENDAYGVPFGSVAERVAALIACCRDLRAAGVQTWVGGRSRAVRRAAAKEADGWNGWGWCSDPEVFAAAASEIREMAHGPELTWGGQVLVGRTRAEVDDKLTRHGNRRGLVYGTVDDLTRHVGALAQAGASWVICAPLDVGTDPRAIELMAEVASASR